MFCAPPPPPNIKVVAAPPPPQLRISSYASANIYLYAGLHHASIHTAKPKQTLLYERTHTRSISLITTRLLNTHIDTHARTHLSLLETLGPATPSTSTTFSILGACWWKQTTDFSKAGNERFHSSSSMRETPRLHAPSQWMDRQQNARLAIPVYYSFQYRTAVVATLV